MNATKLKRFKEKNWKHKNFRESTIRNRNKFKNESRLLWDYITKGYFQFNEEGC